MFSISLIQIKVILNDLISPSPGSGLVNSYATIVPVTSESSDSCDSQSQIYLSEQTTRRDTAGAGHTATWWLLSPAQARILLGITDTIQQCTNLMMGDGNMSYRI